MRRIIIVLMLVTGLTASAQHNELRDSLNHTTAELDQHPDSIGLLLKCAGWKVMLEQWQSAKNDYDRVLRLEPDNPSALYYRAYVNERLGRYNFARLDYNNLLRIVRETLSHNSALHYSTRRTSTTPRHSTASTDSSNNIPTTPSAMPHEGESRPNARCSCSQSTTLPKPSCAVQTTKTTYCKESKCTYSSENSAKPNATSTYSSSGVSANQP